MYILTKGDKLTIFDGIWLEAEHGGIDFADISDLTRACDLWDKTSITRVHQNEAGVIYRTLDRGSQSICVPHVNTAEEARNVVDAAKFAGMTGGETGNIKSQDLACSQIHNKYACTNSGNCSWCENQDMCLSKDLSDSKLQDIFSLD